MKNSLIPRSKAKTAYGLLSDVCTVIMDEPKRYDQTRYIMRPEEDDAPLRGFPSCNTVCCVAGWAVVLRGERNTPYCDVPDRAAVILGLSDFQRNELFSGSALWRASERAQNPQTPEHTDAGVAHIRRFQTKYKTQLLAKKVTR